MDYGHKLTDEELEKLEKRIAKEYETAEKEVQDKLFDYLQDFQRKDESQKAKVDSGEMSQTEYNNWRVNQMAVGKKWESLRNSLAEDFHNTNNIAKEMVKEHSYDIYALNHNYGTYEVEMGSGLNTSYTLYDRATVERLVRDNPDMLPPPGKKVAERIKAGLDVRWNNQQIQSVMLQGLLQGESIPKLAKRLAEAVGDKDKAGAIRNARTMTTGAQNAGRVDAYKRAVDMGIKTKQRWIATLDERTRHSHRQMDGEMVDVGEVFSNKLRFPGDPLGEPSEVYNCRCRIISALEGTALAGNIEDLPRLSKVDDYNKWKGNQESAEDNRERYALNAIKGKYPNSVIGDFQDGKVTFQFDDKPRAKEYTYNVSNYQKLADKLRISYGETPFEQSFFGETKAVSNQYFKMDRQVSDDGKIIAFATTDVKVMNGSPALIVGEHDVIFLKENQYAGVGIRNGDVLTDAIMVKISESEFENAKRYSYKTDFGIGDISFGDLKKIATEQQEGDNSYKTYAIAIYRDRIETSVGKKGKVIV